MDNCWIAMGQRLPSFHIYHFWMMQWWMTPHTGILCCLLTRDSLTTTSNYHVLIDDAGIASCNAGRIVMKHMTALKQCWTFKAKNRKMLDHISQMYSSTQPTSLSPSSSHKLSSPSPNPSPKVSSPNKTWTRVTHFCHILSVHWPPVLQNNIKVLYNPTIKMHKGSSYPSWRWNHSYLIFV
jgi:hypothetical protein